MSRLGRALVARGRGNASKARWAKIGLRPTTCHRTHRRSDEFTQASLRPGTAATSMASMATPVAREFLSRRIGCSSGHTRPPKTTRAGRPWRKPCRCDRPCEPKRLRFPSPGGRMWMGASIPPNIDVHDSPTPLAMNSTIRDRVLYVCVGGCGDALRCAKGVQKRKTGKPMIGAPDMLCKRAPNAETYHNRTDKSIMRQGSINKPGRKEA